jgi:hypothetical protein
MSTRDFFRRHVLHNLTLKLTSLALAAGFWVAVSSSPPSEVALNVPIIFRNMPADLEISSENIPGAQIRVRGPEAIVRRLQASEVSAEIDVTGIRSGERTFDLTHQIHVPDRLTISQVVPSEIHVSFDARSTRSVPVQARVIGEVPHGYTPKFQYDPAVVEVTGPQKQVATVQVATTDPVDITGVVSSISVARHAYVSDPLIQVSSPGSVRITVTMQRENPSSKTQPQ